MRTELNNFVEKLEALGIDVKHKKQYIKFSNNIVAIATNKKIKFSVTNKVQTNGLNLEDCTGKFPLGRYTRRAIATQENLTSVLEQIETILTTQELT